MDITKCNDEECELKHQCFRHEAIPDEYQSYFIGSPRIKKKNPNEKDKCLYFWKIKNDDQIIN
jgi:hypothetical protein